MESGFQKLIGLAEKTLLALTYTLILVSSGGVLVML